MDGKRVDQAVREHIRPLLRSAGFHSFTGRRAWRSNDDTIDHVVVGSLGSYIADGVGCTTFSFGIEAAVFYACAEEIATTRPKEYHCTFRFILGKSLRQPFFHPYGKAGPDRPDIWYVLPDGSNLDDCIADAAKALQNQGLPLMERFTEPHQAYRALLTQRSSVVGYDNPQVWMPGNPGSPRWRETTEAIGTLIDADVQNDLRNAPVLSPR
jgi:hypothetical protein